MATSSAIQDHTSPTRDDDARALPIEGEDKASDKASEEVGDKITGDKGNVAERPEGDAQPLYSIYTLGFLTICGGVYLIVFAIFVPETVRNMKWQSYAAVREHSAEKALEMLSLGKPRKFRFPNPLKALLVIGEKDCAVILFYNAIIYTAWYTVTANLSNMLSTEYGLGALQIGLCYIPTGSPFGAGAAISIMLNGYIQDRNYAKVARAHGFPVEKKRGTDLTHFPIERARMASVWPLIYVGGAATIGFGWAIDQHTPLAVPLVMTFLMALWLTAVYNSMNILLIDLYPNSPSTASAANNLTRCFMAAGGPPSSSR
ncbi:hypothetical protein DV736_g6424, partial [Chaetothyriales sp. CBS 134916]